MKTHTRLQQLGRKIKLNYYKLLRSPSGAGKVSSGFAIGFGLEIILPYTVYLGYLLLYPLVLLFRTTLPPALIGNVLCKLTLLPLLLIPLGHRISRYLLIPKPHFMPKLVFKYLTTLLGLSICGVIVGLLAYVTMYILFEANRKYRMKSRKNRNHLVKPA